MATSSWGRPRRVAAAASALTVITVVVAAVIPALGVGVPDAWWPHTGQAFAADTRTAHQDSCDLIVGPAKVYCERGTTATASAERQGVAGAAWRLATAGSGVAALVVWRLRRTAVRRRP